MINFLSLLREDARFHYKGSLPRLVPLRFVTNPSLVAVFYFRMATSKFRLLRLWARWNLLAVFSSDVSGGAKLRGPVDLPHPTGIVIGSGVVIGSSVRIYQNTTLGTSRRGAYPVIGDDVTIYANAVISGDVTIGSGATIGANCTVTSSVLPHETVKR